LALFRNNGRLWAILANTMQKAAVIIARAPQLLSLLRAAIWRWVLAHVRNTGS